MNKKYSFNCFLDKDNSFSTFLWEEISHILNSMYKYKYWIIYEINRINNKKLIIIYKYSVDNFLN